MPNIFYRYVAYLRDNPKGYWFRRKLYGWGWTPVRWQGWAVVAVAVAILVAGAYVGEVDDAPGAMIIALFLVVVLVFVFGFWKGEPPRWQWGLPEAKPRSEEFNGNI